MTSQAGDALAEANEAYRCARAMSLAADETHRQTHELVQASRRIMAASDRSDMASRVRISKHRQGLARSLEALKYGDGVPAPPEPHPEP